MAYENKVIKAPVSIRDIQTALENSSEDLKTLATSNSINKWAKFKPVNLSKTTPPYIPIINTINQLNMTGSNNNWSWKTDSDWWKGTNGNCGLTMHQYENLNELLLDYFDIHDPNYQVKWHWDAEHLNNDNYARMSDFVGYRHNATQPLHDFMSNR